MFSEEHPHVRTPTLTCMLSSQTHTCTVRTELVELRFRGGRGGAGGREESEIWLRMCKGKHKHKHTHTYGSLALID